MTTDWQIGIRRGLASILHWFCFQFFIALSGHEALREECFPAPESSSESFAVELCGPAHLSRFFPISTYALYRLSSPTTAEQNSFLFLESREYLQALFKAVGMTMKLSCFLTETRYQPKHQTKQLINSWVI